jgi:hypothetical protein
LNGHHVVVDSRRRRIETTDCRVGSRPAAVLSRIGGEEAEFLARSDLTGLSPAYIWRSMQCSFCGSDNRDGRKFCAECGATLVLACVACGVSNQPGERFCGECGRPLAKPEKPEPRLDTPSYTPKHLAEMILTSRSALAGERKQVTVIFADVKGSMDLAEQVDPEEWHKIMPVLRDPLRASPPLRGHDQPVHR